MIREGRQSEKTEINGVYHLVVFATRNRDGTVMRAVCGLTASPLVDDLVTAATEDCLDCIRQGMEPS